MTTVNTEQNPTSPRYIVINRSNNKYEPQQQRCAVVWDTVGKREGPFRYSELPTFEENRDLAQREADNMNAYRAAADIAPAAELVDDDYASYELDEYAHEDEAGHLDGLEAYYEQYESDDNCYLWVSHSELSTSRDD